MSSGATLIVCFPFCMTKTIEITFTIFHIIFIRRLADKVVLTMNFLLFI